MYLFIVNPTAGSGRAMRIFTKVMKSQLYQEIESRYFLTKYHGHAEEIIRKTSKSDLKKIVAIIVIGGDGTLHGVINGLGRHRIPVSVIPGGSGNDFARGCSIDDKPIDILQAIISGQNELPYWIGNYQIDNNLKRFFVNSIGFGFDAEIAQTANKSHYKKILNRFGLGKISYIIALIQVLSYFQPFEVEIEVNGKKRIISECWMITITNHPYYGGGMKIIPNATIQPSVFPILLVHSISKWKVLALFMTVFTGRHVNFKEVELLEATKLTIATSSKIYYQADGETATCSSCVLTKHSNPVQIVGTGTEQFKKEAL